MLDLGHLRLFSAANEWSAGSWRLRLSAGLAAALACTCAAAAIDYGAIFSLKGQSVYAPGPALDVNVNERLGPAPFSYGNTYGGMLDPCPIYKCPTGVRAGADTNGNFGLRYGAKFNSGSYDLLYPVNASISAPAAYSSTVGNAFTLGSSYRIPGYGAPAYQEMLNGQRMIAKLTTHSPTIQAYVDLDARFHAFVGAQACLVGVCTGPAMGADGDASRTLASINRNNDGQIRVGDQTVGLRTYFSTLDGNLTARLNIPNVDAVSNTSTSAANNLRSFGRDNIAVLGANVGNLVSKAVGLPLVGNVAGIGYNLVSINAGIGFDLSQTISVALKPIETYNFLSPVQSLLSGGGWSAPTRQVVVPLGQNLVLKSNVLNLGVVPSTSLELTFSNLTELVVQGDFNVQALAADIYGLKIGPLYDSGAVNAGQFSIPLYQDSFSFNMNAVTGLPFNIVQSPTDSIPLDFGYRASFVVGNQGADGLESGEIRSQDLSCLLFVCASVPIANTDPSMLSQDGSRIFMVDGDTLTLATNQPGEVGTDAAQLALLHATGFSPDRVELISPIGLPSPIPEPGSAAMLLLGGLVLVLKRKVVRS